MEVRAVTNLNIDPGPMFRLRGSGHKAERETPGQLFRFESEVNAGRGVQPERLTQSQLFRKAQRASVSGARTAARRASVRRWMPSARSASSGVTA